MQVCEMCNQNVMSLSGIYTAMKKPAKAHTPAAPAAPPTAPKQNDAVMMNAVEEERKRQVLAGQNNTTNLTGPQGLTTQAPTQKKTLLGQ